MDAQLKKGWIEALRSGKYAQTENELMNENGYCCLGVLCDIATDQVYWKKYTAYDLKGFTSAINLPRYFTEELFGNSNTDVPIPELLDRENDKCSLTELNDAGMTFNQIADIIEYFL